MTRHIPLRPFTTEVFAPFGDIIAPRPEPDFQINAGMCDRYDALSIVDTVLGEVGISMGRGRAYDLPLTLKMMERHPLGSQAFIPLDRRPFAVIVAEDRGGQPGTPLAFVTDGRQGVHYFRNIWHGVLTPLSGPQDFLIIDRIGPEPNLEEHFFETPYIIKQAES